MLIFSLLKQQIPSLILGCLVFLTGCGSTSSIIIAENTGEARVAILPLEGPLGEQAADLISQELAQKGVAVVESSRVRSIVSIDTDFNTSQPARVDVMKDLGEELGVNFLFTGTVSAEGGPLYSFDHVNMTLRLIDVRSGQTRWIGRYGNSIWTSAISTQGDMQRGARNIVDEFIDAGGPSVLDN